MEPAAHTPATFKNDIYPNYPGLKNPKTSSHCTNRIDCAPNTLVASKPTAYTTCCHLHLNIHLHSHKKSLPTPPPSSPKLLYIRYRPSNDNMSDLTTYTHYYIYIQYTLIHNQQWRIYSISYILFKHLPSLTQYDYIYVTACTTQHTSHSSSATEQQDMLE